MFVKTLTVHAMLYALSLAMRVPTYAFRQSAGLREIPHEDLFTTLQGKFALVPITPSIMLVMSPGIADSSDFIGWVSKASELGESPPFTKAQIESILHTPPQSVQALYEMVVPNTDAGNLMRCSAIDETDEKVVPTQIAAWCGDYVQCDLYDTGYCSRKQGVEGQCRYCSFSYTNNCTYTARCRR